MSNSMVGSVYQKIMDEVIENCVVTFEEDGVERKLLDEVKKTWQQKLSERKVAVMPWDPAPAMPTSTAPVPSGSAASTARAQKQQEPSPGIPEAGPVAPKASTAKAGGPQIKTEPGATIDLQNLPQASHTAPTNGVTVGNNPNDALNRASQLIKEKYGSAANTQVNQLQARVAMNQSGQNGQSQPQVQPTPASPQMLEEQRRKLYAQQQTQLSQQKMQSLQAQRQQQQNTVANGQTDGPADWSALVAERRAAASEGGVDADISLRQRIESMALAMEGGGLMLPISQLPKPKSRKRRSGHHDVQFSGTTEDLVAAQYAHAPSSSNITQRDGPSRTNEELVAAQYAPSSSKIAQHDGAEESDDDKSNVRTDADDDDEDAINSDLDDPDDDVPEEAEEDANQGEIMLCTYDKVQRVKNKWKCTLKDGVLTTGGKEYVFHKANGEFEW